MTGVLRGLLRGVALGFEPEGMPHPFGVLLGVLLGVIHRLDVDVAALPQLLESMGTGLPRTTDQFAHGVGPLRYFIPCTAIAGKAKHSNVSVNRNQPAPCQMGQVRRARQSRYVLMNAPSAPRNSTPGTAAAHRICALPANAHAV